MIHSIVVNLFLASITVTAQNVKAFEIIVSKELKSRALSGLGLLEETVKSYRSKCVYAIAVVPLGRVEKTAVGKEYTSLISDLYGVFSYDDAEYFFDHILKPVEATNYPVDASSSVLPVGALKPHVNDIGKKSIALFQLHTGGVGLRVTHEANVIDFVYSREFSEWLQSRLVRLKAKKEAIGDTNEQSNRPPLPQSIAPTKSAETSTKTIKSIPKDLEETTERGFKVLEGFIKSVRKSSAQAIAVLPDCQLQKSKTGREYTDLFAEYYGILSTGDLERFFDCLLKPEASNQYMLGTGNRLIPISMEKPMVQEYLECPISIFQLTTGRIGLRVRMKDEGEFQEYIDFIYSNETSTWIRSRLVQIEWMKLGHE